MEINNPASQDDAGFNIKQLRPESWTRGVLLTAGADNLGVDGFFRQ